MVCDLCNSDSSDGQLISPSKMVKAIKKGFTISKIGGMTSSLGMALGLNSATMDQGWKVQAMASPSDWYVCPGCMRILKNYL